LKVQHKTIPLKDIDRRLIILLRTTSDVVLKARNRELRKYGISLEEWGVLNIAQLIGETATPAEIARWLFREHHSVTSLLNRMVKKGLIKRTKDLERKNLVRVNLTELGHKTYLAARKARVHEQIASNLSIEDRKQLIRYLYEIRAGAQNILGIEYTPPFP
jgi:DNA-binding MarR family transcriptional regulator